MCGILGYSHRRKGTPGQVVHSALKSIEHRGPDQHGHFSCDQMTLGATRLRILDLHGGDQPVFSADRNVVVVFNGEIFNQHELRAELMAEGFTFRTHCDTEVVLNAFLRWGIASFSRFRGMFGIAIWVQSEGRLILVRDHVGIKPLYYCLRGGEIYFGSELKTILAHPQVSRNICLDGLNAYLSLNYVPGPHTLVEGIVKLMPGHFLEWKQGRAEVKAYLKRTDAKPPKTVDDAAAELDYLITTSVKEQLVSDVPLGMWLSGGIDSSTVLHYAASAGATNLNTFSVTFNGREFDESRYIREVSSFYGTRHHEFDLGEDADLVDAIDQIAYYSDEPSADAGAVPLWFLSRMTTEKVTVALSGEGADELFAGYLTYKADRYAGLARRIPAPLRKAALRCAQLLPVSDEKISFEYKLKRFLKGTLLSPELAHVFWNGTFSEQEKCLLFRYADANPLAAVLECMKSGSGLGRYLQYDQRYYLPDDILYKVDRISMAHSLEVRPPFLDPRIVDFTRSLPDDFKLCGTTSKYVLRRLMRGKLPPSVLQRPKVGFDIPIHEWFRGVLRPLLLDTLSEEAITQTNLFYWPAVESLLADHLARRRNVGYHLWGLMVLLLWIRKWKIETPAAESTPLAPAAVAEEVGLYS
ncbi:MAG: asparagine synthase (glutamine-hydrolyzing) [Terriglobales bacterium]